MSESFQEQLDRLRRIVKTGVGSAVGGWISVRDVAAIKALLQAYDRMDQQQADDAKGAT